MRTNYILSVLLATLLMPPGAVAGPLVPSMEPALRAAPASAASCSETVKIAATANFKRGMVFYGQGDHDHAVAEYSEAIRLDPEMTAAYDGRGHALHTKGNMEGALANFDQASRLRLTEKVDWLVGRSPRAPVSRERQGAVALVAL